VPTLRTDPQLGGFGIRKKVVKIKGAPPLRYPVLVVTLEIATDPKENFDLLMTMGEESVIESIQPEQMSLQQAAEEGKKAAGKGR